MDCANVNAFFGKGGLTAMSTRELYNFVTDPTLVTPALEDARLAALEVAAGEEGEGEQDEDAVFMQTWTPSSLSEVGNCEADQKMRAAGQREGAYSDAVAHLLGRRQDEAAGESASEGEEAEEKEEEPAAGAPNGKAVRNRKGSGPANQTKRGQEPADRGSRAKPRPILLARAPATAPATPAPEAALEAAPEAEGVAPNTDTGGEDSESGSGSESGCGSEDDEDPRSAGWEWDGHAEGRLPPAGSEAREFAKSAKKVRVSIH